MKHYTFHVTLSGYGRTPEEAWSEAIEAFDMDPGNWDRFSEEEVEEEAEENAEDRLVGRLMETVAHLDDADLIALEIVLYDGEPRAEGERMESRVLSAIDTADASDLENIGAFLFGSDDPDVAALRAERERNAPSNPKS